MYLWRKLTATQREELLAFRQFNDRPWHSPPHCEAQDGRYLLTAACYEHVPVIGNSPARLANFSDRLLEVLVTHCTQTYAWCVLPNHYHAVVLTRRLT